VVPDESQFCDRQTLKIQEAPEKVPTGEMPRAFNQTVHVIAFDASQWRHGQISLE
jgi:DNA replicative helicase MCM subunit Mcm2 (Cdc46/Mcm family)